MRILMISQYPWNKDNSFGNSYSSIFGKVEDIEIAHIYLMEGLPDKEDVVTHYYQIPENEVLKSCLKPWKRNKGAGHVVLIEDEKYKQGEKKPSTDTPHKTTVYGKLLGFGKRHHWSLMFFARELAWKYGKVNYEGMMSFIEEFKPDIFFLPFSNLYYTNRLAMYIKKHYDIPMVMEMAMDHYSLKRVSYSPLFWLDRFGKRAMIRELAEISEKIYVISKRLKEELEGSLNIPCEVLYKIPDEKRETTPYENIHNPIRFLFTGNIYANRWKTLKLLADTLNETKTGILDIYTANPITKEISKALNIEGVSTIHKPVSQDKVIELQNDADVLVHVEAFDKANKLLVKCAISTKIMDYLSVGRCILAIGPSDIASIEYLSDNNLALIADSKRNLHTIIVNIRTNPAIIGDYAKREVNYTKNNLNAKVLRKGLYDSMNEVIFDYKKKDYGY